MEELALGDPVEDELHGKRSENDPEQPGHDMNAGAADHAHDERGAAHADPRCDLRRFALLVVGLFGARPAREQHIDRDEKEQYAARNREGR
jgi:hypothetical protein